MNYDTTVAQTLQSKDATAPHALDGIAWLVLDFSSSPTCSTTLYPISIHRLGQAKYEKLCQQEHRTLYNRLNNNEIGIQYKVNNMLDPVANTMEMNNLSRSNTQRIVYT